MDRIRILDCTLRDGGYVNDFRFGKEAICEMIRKLANASIDIIECGFLRSGDTDADRSTYGSVEELSGYIGRKNRSLMYVAMVQYGAISAEEICDCREDSIDGIRVTFHEHEIDPAFVLGRALMDKGYKVFMQPVGTATYTDEALLALIMRINQLKPYAFYMVDTLGTMYKNDLLRMFYLMDHNLNRKIVLGFHSHNNLQLSFANAQELMQLNTPRRLIVDSSVYGMGRGAGNLNTELVTQYVNTNFGLKYDNLEILEMIDEYVKPLSLKYSWGYNAAYYLASAKGCHPNYASYLLNKQTLHMKDINAILGTLDMEKRTLYDAEYAAEEYTKYQSHHVDDSETVAFVQSQIDGKKVLLLAPGKSIVRQAGAVRNMAASKEAYVVCVNFIPKDVPCDMIFVSNTKRFRHRDFAAADAAVVVTSNVRQAGEGRYQVADYSSYLNEEYCVSDNAGLMCINLMKKAGAKRLLLAGFDGFSMDVRNNYYDNAFTVDVEAEDLGEMTLAIKRKLGQLKNQLDLEFLTESMYKE